MNGERYVPGKSHFARKTTLRERTSIRKHLLSKGKKNATPRRQRAKKSSPAERTPCARTGPRLFTHKLSGKRLNKLPND